MHAQNKCLFYLPLCLQKPPIYHLLSCSVVAIDMSHAQTSILELKLAAIRQLSYHDFLVLIGEVAATGDEREAVFQAMKHRLPPQAKVREAITIDIVNLQSSYCLLWGLYFKLDKGGALFEWYAHMLNVFCINHRDYNNSIVPLE